MQNKKNTSQILRKRICSNNSKEDTKEDLLHNEIVNSNPELRETGIKNTYHTQFSFSSEKTGIRLQIKRS